ncbi:MAG: hypothetical protein RBT50_00100 [Bacteroidales bacterium]|jgi:hypothetical protein|nr:hypothetical protein [Bacteroidales bacterium]
MIVPDNNNSILRLTQKSMCFFCLLLLVSASLCGQGAVNFSNAPGKVLLNPEEIRLVTDRDIYVAGEEVLFSVTQVGRLTHTPGTISRVVYVDLLDSHRTPVVQVRAGSDGFTGAGAFRIPDTLRTGNYFIRSFTSLMKNYPQSLFAYRMITVINPFRSLASIKIPPSDHQADSVVFFPETGALVAGLQSRVGIRCFNDAGDPVVTRGTVLTASGDTAAVFSTDRFGSALFTLTPPDAGRLSLITTDRTGAGRRFEMPRVQAAGVTFYASPQDNKGGVILRLAASAGYTPGMVKVIIAPVCFSPVVKEVYAAGSQDVTFESGTLPEGLARITVADMQGRELASRWYYHSRIPGLQLDVSISSATISLRDKAEVSVRATDGNGKTLAGVMSVSVVKPVLVNEHRFDEFARNLQFPSVQAFRTEMKLPGINDYLIFSEENGDLRVPSGAQGDIVYLPEPEGHLISGVVRDSETDEPLAGEDLSLSIVGRSARCTFTKSDSEGRFRFPVMEYGRKEIVIQRLRPAERGYYIDLIDPFLFEMRLRQVPGPYYPDTTRLDELNDAIVSMQVSNIYDPFLRKRSARLFSGNFPGFFGEPDRTVILSDYIQLSTLREVFKELVPGLASGGREENLTLTLTNRYPGISFNSPPLVILDGVPVYDLDKLLDIPSSRIEKVEVLSVRYFTGDIVTDGIINIVSHKGDLSAMEFDRSILRQEYDMLLDSYDIFAPDYSTDSLRLSRIPDYRNTLYWNPSVMTDSHGEAAVDFWTSDEAGEFLVITEFTASDGRRGRKVIPFRVAKKL